VTAGCVIGCRYGGRAGRGRDLASAVEWLRDRPSGRIIERQDGTAWQEISACLTTSRALSRPRFSNHLRDLAGEPS
jgi:hypothetical protein